jgi:hypothetical protein
VIFKSNENSYKSMHSWQQNWSGNLKNILIKQVCEIFTLNYSLDQTKGPPTHNFLESPLEEKRFLNFKFYNKNWVPLNSVL